MSFFNILRLFWFVRLLWFDIWASAWASAWVIEKCENSNIFKVLYLVGSVVILRPILMLPVLGFKEIYEKIPIGFIVVIF